MSLFGKISLKNAPGRITIPLYIYYIVYTVLNQNGGIKMANVTFETVKAEEVKFGRNNFIEVARKKATTDQGENEFIAISRGFFLPDGTKKFKRSIAIPDEKEIKKFISERILEY